MMLSLNIYINIFIIMVQCFILIYELISGVNDVQKILMQEKLSEKHSFTASSPEKNSGNDLPEFVQESLLKTSSCMENLCLLQMVRP